MHTEGLPVAAPTHGINLGLPGHIEDAAYRPSRAPAVLGERPPSPDLDLQAMAGAALTYLTRTPRPHRDYEPIFQCHLAWLPPFPEGEDTVVACDTDARMLQEYVAMRQIAGHTDRLEVDAGFWKRMLAYLRDDGLAYAPAGCFHEDDTSFQGEPVPHCWGTLKILVGLAERFRATGDGELRPLMRRMFEALRAQASWDATGRRAWFAGGMGPGKKDAWLDVGFWSRHPAPVVSHLLHYYVATGDAEALEFCRAFADGYLANSQPDGIRIEEDGSFIGHMHGTLHRVWGVAWLGALTGETRYVEWAARVHEFVKDKGTGTGAISALISGRGQGQYLTCMETCATSDLVSLATYLGLAGRASYFDQAERYVRNHMRHVQFALTDDYRALYRQRHADRPAEAERWLARLEIFQGGFVGGCGPNGLDHSVLPVDDYSTMAMFGCCAPEGMRAVATAWRYGVTRESDTVRVHMGFSRRAPDVEVVSFLPDQGRITVRVLNPVAVEVRCPSWAAHDDVRVYRGTEQMAPPWRGDYVEFGQAERGEELSVCFPLLTCRSIHQLWAEGPAYTMDWQGNTVVAMSPPARALPFYPEGR